MLHIVPSCFACTAVDQQLIAASSGRRISRALRRDKTVWIKRMNCNPPMPSRRFHATFFSRLLKPYLRAAPLRSLREQA